MANSRLQYLFTRHYLKEATAEEKEELLKLIQQEENASELNKLVEAALREPAPGYELDNTSADNILNSILQTEKEETSVVHLSETKSRKRYYIAAAAALLVLGIAATYRLSQKPKASREIVQVPLAHDVAPGGNKAILTLADGSTISLDDAQNGVLALQGTARVIKGDNGELSYLPVGENHITTEPSFNTISTPRGGQYQVRLPDGTKAWLNASSSLKYPTSFNGKERSVTLTGEGYFEVVKNAKQPFHVHVNGMDVEVLGTHFNIMGYEDEGSIRTTLLEGSVKLQKGEANTKLIPGEQASIAQQAEGFTKKIVDTDEDVAWKNGYIQFSDATVPEIMREVARWYDVEVNYETTIPKKEYNGKVPRNVPLSQLVVMLQYTGLRFKVQEKKITVLN